MLFPIEFIMQINDLLKTENRILIKLGQNTYVIILL